MKVLIDMEAQLWQQYVFVTSFNTSLTVTLCKDTRVFTIAQVIGIMRKKQACLLTKE